MGDVEQKLDSLIDAIKQIGCNQRKLDLNVCRNGLKLDNVNDTTQGHNQKIQAVATKLHEGDISGAFVPNPFSGKSMECAQTFLENVNRYATYAGKDDLGKCELFPLLLKSRAIQWYNELSDDLKTNWHNLTEAFTLRFGPQSLDLMQQHMLLDIQQKSSQSVAEFTEDFIKRLNLAGVTGEERWRKYVHTLRPPIKSYVLERDPKSWTDVERLASRAEQVERTNNSGLSEKLDSLIDAIASKSLGQAQTTTHSIEVETNRKLDKIVNVLEHIPNLVQSQPYVQTLQYTNDSRGRPRDRQDRDVSQNRSYSRQRTPDRNRHRGKFCTHCRKSNHTNNECSFRQQSQRSNNRTNNCFRCNQPGHYARDCLN